MTSQINPNNIDGNYPIAGVSNNTQGMRDNFTAIKTNFQYAENEIEDGSLVGAYMKVGTNQLSITEQENASVLYGLQRAEYGNDTQYGFIVDYPSANPPGPYPLVTYPMSVLDGAGNYVDYTVPFGSRVGVNLNFYRTGKGNTKKRTMFLSVLSVTMIFNPFPEWI